MIGSRVYMRLLLFLIKEMMVKNMLMLLQVVEVILGQFGNIIIRKINGTKWRILPV